MDDKTLTKIAQSCWSYAETSDYSSVSDDFARWFKIRARTLFLLNDAEINQVWNAALQMHS